MMLRNIPESEDYIGDDMQYIWETEVRMRIRGNQFRFRDVNFDL